MPDLVFPVSRLMTVARALFARPRRQGAVATPLVLQAEAAECGLAALAIVLGHHGVHARLESLRRRAGAVRNGVTARDLATLAASFGFVLRAKRLEPAGLSALALPAILHWRFNHFIVLEAVESGRIRINDPAGGPRWLDADEIDEDFTGIALLVHPGPAVAPEGRAFSLWRSAAALVLRRPAAGWHLAAALILAAAGVGAMHQVAALVEGVGSLTAGLAACTAFLAALAFFNSTAHGLEHALGEVMTRRAGERLATAPASFFWQRAPRALAALPRLPAGDAAAPWFAAVDLGLAGVLAAAMLTLAPPVAALPTVALGLSLATTALLLLRRGSALPDAMQRDAELVSPETGAITMLINNRCGGRDGELFAQLAGSHAMHAKRRRSGRRLAVGLDGARAALRLIALAGGLGLGAVGVAEGWTTGGAVVAIFAASLALDALTERIAGRLARVTASRATLIAWREQIEAPPPDAALARPAVSIPVTGELVFADVSVRPCASRPAVLTAFSCVVASGTHVAIEGPGGAGKTLLLRLACGLAAPEVGLITFGGQPIETASRLRPGLVGCIGRAPAFGRASLRETLGCGASRWSDRALQAVLDETRLWDAIAPRGGLDLILTPDAPELSGGQRARLGLARALLREPALLCLDATLDSVEADLQTTLLAALRRRGCTVLLVSHHQYLRAACDRRLSLPWSGGSCDAAR